MKPSKLTSVLALGAALVSSAAHAQLSGAIFTTTASGTTTNGNIYQNIGDVYLNGGPQNMNSAGLPDGTYYFQVTDPNGGTLLSTDSAACRELVVVNGVVAGATGTCPHTNGTFNPANGSTPVQLAPFNPTPNPGGEYKVWLIPIGSATVETDGITLDFSSSDAKTDNFKILCTNSGGCGNPQKTPPTITGFKWYDTNANGVFDPGELLIPGWRINALDTLTSALFFTYTDGSGNYSFPADANNTYTISEAFPNSTWIATACVAPAQTNNTDSDLAVTTCTSNTSASVFTGDATPTVNGPDFGNVCLGAGGGLTLGFWSNKNGQALITSAQLSTLDSLNLRDAAGNNFDPTTNTALRTWLLNGTATNMAYMLSVQLATMELNVLNSKVSGSTLVYAPGTGLSSPPSLPGFVTITDLMNAANTDLATHNIVLGGNPDRAYQQALESALDQANNNINFVQPGPSSCPFTSPY